MAIVSQNRHTSVIPRMGFWCLVFATLLVWPGRVSAGDGTLFRPLFANPFEGRVGVIGQPGQKLLRLDIGNSFDLLVVGVDSSTHVSTGLDFFTYTRLRSDGNFKFPVETSDYFFGGNLAIVQTNGRHSYSARLRIAHISSHLVDGYADSSGRFSRQLPFVYSREFAELIGAYQYESWRIYGGVTYVWATLPRDLSQWLPQVGFDQRLSLTDALDFRWGGDVRLVGFRGVYPAVFASQAGVVVRGMSGRGLFAGLYGYAGPSMHGMFYDQHDGYIGVGLQGLF